MFGLKIAAVFVMGAAIGILYRVPRGVLLYCSLCGMLAWLASEGLMQIHGNLITASFCGGTAVGILSEILARGLRQPATVFVIPGFIPLVPGREAYTSMRLLVEGQHLEAMSMGIQTLLMAGAIAFGIFASVTIYRLILNYRIRSGITEHADKS